MKTYAFACGATIACVVACLALLGACTDGDDVAYEASGPVQAYGVDHPEMFARTIITVWTDPATTCQHYVTPEGFMLPRMNAAGYQVCNDDRLEGPDYESPAP